MPQNCLYCQNKSALDALMLYLFREQTHQGRRVVTIKD